MTEGQIDGQRFRHGSKRGWRLGCGCDGCRLMGCVYASKRTKPKRRYAKRRPAESSVLAAPFRDVLRAAVDNGSTVAAAARVTGMQHRTLSRIYNGEVERIWASTARRLMVLPILLPPEKHR